MRQYFEKRYGLYSWYNLVFLANLLPGLTFTLMLYIDGWYESDGGLADGKNLVAEVSAFGLLGESISNYVELVCQKFSFLKEHTLETYPYTLRHRSLCRYHRLIWLVWNNGHHWNKVFLLVLHCAVNFRSIKCYSSWVFVQQILKGVSKYSLQIYPTKWQANYITFSNYSGSSPTIIQKSLLAEIFTFA